MSVTAFDVINPVDETVVATVPLAGRGVVRHPLVRKIVFTGSTAVGKRIMRLCADQVKPLTLELGGKNANIVFADADLEKAAASAPAAAFANSGQDCCSRSRVLVQRSVFDRFMELLEPAVKGFTVGDPADPVSAMGPLISARHREKVSSYVDEQAVVAFQGAAPPGSGFWFPPTVLSPVSAGDRQWREEIFGPVIAVGELAFVGALLDPLRGGQAVRAGPGTGPGRRRRVHRHQNVFISTEE